MLILRCSSKLRLLEGALRRGLPKTLPVHGAVMNINRGNPAGNEVLVDSWPEFKVVLSWPRREVHRARSESRALDGGSGTPRLAGELQGRGRPDARHPREALGAWKVGGRREVGGSKRERPLLARHSDYYTNQHAALCQEDGAWQALLETTDAVDWSRAFQLNSFQNGVYKAIRDMAKAKGIHLDLLQYLMLLHPDPPSMPHFRLKEGLTLAPVSSAHAALLNDTWNLGGNLWSLRYLEMLIRCFPSACLLGPDGHPVSWSLTDSLACLTHGYTLPTYRGQHCQGVVLGALVGQLHAQGFPAFCRVLPENKPSLHALHGLGFCNQPGVLYQMVLKPDPTLAPGH